MNSTITSAAASSSGAEPLWTTLDGLLLLLTSHRAVDIQFVTDRTPMSSLWEVAAVLSSYYTIILGGRQLMRYLEAFKLNGAFKAHNLLLTIASGFMLALFVEQLAPTLWRDGIYANICGSDGWTKQLVTLYYLNYITKYLELIDTVFLVLRKKPLTFLHTYHHGATALLCYTQLVGHTPVSWVPITANLLVHVVMYYYYFQAARGIKVWWKQYITQLQILQFIIDLAFIYFASWNYFASAYAPSFPHVGTCAGEPLAAFCGCAILSSYLVLFLAFYTRTYKKGKSEKQTLLEASGKMAALDVATQSVHFPDMKGSGHNGREQVVPVLGLRSEPSGELSTNLAV